MKISANLIVELSGWEGGMLHVAGRRARSLPNFIARSLVNTNPAILLDLGPMVGREAAPATYGYWCCSNGAGEVGSRLEATPALPCLPSVPACPLARDPLGDVCLAPVLVDVELIDPMAALPLES
jgi:hypothetical protein